MRCNKKKKIRECWKEINEVINSNPVTSLIITFFLTIIAGLIVYFSPTIIGNYRCNKRPYVTFNSDNTQIFHLSKEVPTFEYSVGGKKWKKLGTQNVVFGGDRGMLLLRGKSGIGTDGASISFASNAEVVCSGDIRTLVDYEHYEVVSTAEATFEDLFANCEQLVTAPELPAEILAKECYYGMFLDCTSLRIAPKLPSNSLSDNCYSLMFCGCTSLISAPELPAKNLTEWCYSGMFYGCTSLKQAPRMHAESLAAYCCFQMFCGCTSLIRAPELLAEDLARYCYKGMFYGCTSLESAHVLPATNMDVGCYSYMFSGCVSLSIPTGLLPAKNLAVKCYEGMFSDCTSLEYAPILPAENLATSCYKEMFCGCTSLMYIDMQAIEINTEDCLSDWLDGIPSCGIFCKNRKAKWSNVGVVPEGWRVELIDP